MGNRAIISTRNEYDNNTLGVYLHWNGGRDSVEAFLAYCDLRGDRSPETDGYGYARLAQVVGNYFGGNFSIGIVSDPKDWADGCDNGAYIVENWQIVGREGIGEHFTEQDDYDLLDMMLSINEAQPKPFPREYVAAGALERAFPLSYEEKLELLEVGSEIFVRDFNGSIEKYKVLGFGEPGRIVNGQEVEGVPFYEFTRDGFRDYSGETEEERTERLRGNINSYLTERTCFYLPQRPDVKKVQRTLLDLI